MKRNANIDAGNSNVKSLNFSSILRVDVPEVRKGKHKELVSRILDDLERTKEDTAVRVPLAVLEGEKMQNVRSALNRVTRAKNLNVATAADEQYLYVWRKAQQ